MHCPQIEIAFYHHHHQWLFLRRNKTRTRKISSQQARKNWFSDKETVFCFHANFSISWIFDPWTWKNTKNLEWSICKQKFEHVLDLYFSSDNLDFSTENTNVLLFPYFSEVRYTSEQESFINLQKSSRTEVFGLVVWEGKLNVAVNYSMFDVFRTWEAFFYFLPLYNILP